MMTPVKSLARLSFMSLMLSGCNASMDSCSSSETQDLMQKDLTEQAVRSITQKRDDLYDGALIFGATKVRASLAEIRIVLENIKTVKQDPKSNVSSCTGQLKITVPTPMLADVDMARDSQYQIKIAQYAGQLAIENSRNAFTQTVDYSVKSLEDGKAGSIEFKSTPWVHLLDEIITAALLKPTLDHQEVNASQHNEPPIHEVEPVKHEVEVRRVFQEKQATDSISKDAPKAEPTEKIIPKAPVPQQTVQPSLSPEVAIQKISPGFNCNKASKPTDVTICANSALAVLDLENMALYKNAKVVDPVMTKIIWQESIQSKYACGIDISCITKVYKKSMQRYECVAGKKKLC